MILKGDCIEVMKAMKPNSVDAIVTDPPYGLEFMGKEWDKLWDKREFGIDEYSKKSYTCSDGSTRKTNPVSRKLYNPNYKAGIEAQLWHTRWLTEAYRVLKPGGSMLVMGGTRTSHRLACAIEDSGFIIKDTLMWLFGSGFPKCQDITPMIDGKILGITTKQVKERREKIGKNPNDRKKRENTLSNYGLQGGVGKADITKSLTPEAKHWDGFKVGGIKPSFEPIIWAVKPPEGSYVDNVLKWGVGAVNVAECRIGFKDNDNRKNNPVAYGQKKATSGFSSFNKDKTEYGNIPKGRFPANVILSHHPECVQVGMKRVKTESGGKPTMHNGSPFKQGKRLKTIQPHHHNPDGYEQVESWDCHPDCAVRLLDEQSGVSKSPSTYKRKADGINRFSYGKGMGELSGKESLNYGDNGGASRFFYCAKASRSERNVGLEGMPDKLHGQSGGATQALKEGKSEYIQKDHIGLNKIKIVKNNHPTVKPIKLFEWLIKLVTREGQIILDPFIGSGTTVIAAHNTGRKCVGIEKQEEYLEIAKRRITYWESQPKQMEMRV